MTSDPNVNPEFEHWLNEAGDEQTGQSTGDMGIDDLIDLFDDSEPTEIEVADPQTDFNPTRMILDFDSPEAELDALFAGEAEPTEKQIEPIETSSWLAMEDEEQSPNAYIEPSELMELRELLGVESNPDASHSVEFSLSLSQDELTISPYPTLEDLDTWLARDQQTIVPELMVSELEALIESPPPLQVGIERDLLLQSDDVEDNEAEPEDEFKDLEILIEQAERSIGSTSGTSGQRVPAVTLNRATRSKTFEQTMRVPIKQLDNLSNLIGELVVKRNRLEEDQERLRQFLDNLLNQAQGLSDVGGRMQDLYERTLLEGALLASRNSTRSNLDPKQTTIDWRATMSGSSSTVVQEHDLDSLEMDRFTGFHLLSQEMIELIVRVRESASDIQYLVDETDQVARTLRQVTTQLQEGMTKSRMVPFTQTADRLPRAIREVSMQLHKKVNLEVEGRDVLIDKMILEHLYNPVTHLVNNAITHGIETPEERRQAGKPPEGRLKIRAFLQGNQTIITVSDDGAGIDPERVKQKAIEKGLITHVEAQTLSEADVFDFLFQAGFSTKDQADNFSGRGVGLDVVRAVLIDIRGSVSIDSELGKGTTFTIRLPLTLSICKALCCLNNHARLAFPMDGVEDTKDYIPDDIITNEDGQKFVQWNTMQLPLYQLSDLLSYNRQLSRGSVYGGKQEEDLVAVVILRGSGSNFLALQVDQVLGEEEIVIKQLEGPIPKPPGIAGATVRGDGSIMPIGDVLELIEIALGRMRNDSSSGLWRKPSTPSLRSVQLEPTVLIVDDSITVRELLSLSFKKAGFRVEQARDGQEAWEQLKSGLPCDLVFCDIEMPRMNGLELLSQLQGDDELSDIPVALLTSRGADRHRNVAAKLGATGYFTKPYTEKDLLDAAKRMLNGEILLKGSIRQPSSAPPRFKRSQAAFQDQASTANEDQFQPASKTVLIVDDSIMVREMLSATFKKANYRTETARDPREALEKLQTGLPCDLILCDVEMPRMNGLEFLEQLQSHPDLSKIPLALLTSRGAQKTQRLAAEKGAKGYFVKPYVEANLLDASERLMRGEVLLEMDTLGAEE